MSDKTSEVNAKTIPEIAVVVPVKDEQDNIRPLIEEIVTSVGQVTGDFEIIYVNDGSSDGTMDRLAGHETNGAATAHHQPCGAMRSVHRDFKRCAPRQSAAHCHFGR